MDWLTHPVWIKDAILVRLRESKDLIAFQLASMTFLFLLSLLVSGDVFIAFGVTLLVFGGVHVLMSLLFCFTRFFEWLLGD